MTTAPVSVEISPGELIDKITILAIKSERLTDPGQLQNVRTELALLEASRDQSIPGSDSLDDFTASLKSVNQVLWDIEDDIRGCERRRDFGAKFIKLARSVYRNNDQRADIKRKINEILGSEIMEEKSYEPY